MEKQWFATRHRSGWSVNDFVDGSESQYPLAVCQRTVAENGEALASLELPRETKVWRYSASDTDIAKPSEFGTLNIVFPGNPTLAYSARPLHQRSVRSSYSVATLVGDRTPQCVLHTLRLSLAVQPCTKSVFTMYPCPQFYHQF